MKKLSFIALLCASFFLSSCGAFKSYVASYSVGLSAVESPADAKQQFGETKVVTFDKEGISKYRYEDDYIDIVWYVSSKQFNFTLKNKSGHTLKINKDDVSYVDTKGQVGRVMHSGMKYAERNSSQPAIQPYQKVQVFQIFFCQPIMYIMSLVNTEVGEKAT